MTHPVLEAHNWSCSIPRHHFPVSGSAGFFGFAGENRFVGTDQMEGARHVPLEYWLSAPVCTATDALSMHARGMVKFAHPCSRLMTPGACANRAISVKTAESPSASDTTRDDRRPAADDAARLPAARAQHSRPAATTALAATYAVVVETSIVVKRNLGSTAGEIDSADGPRV
jgi:hypothetical protein